HWPPGWPAGRPRRPPPNPAEPAGPLRPPGAGAGGSFDQPQPRRGHRPVRPGQVDHELRPVAGEDVLAVEHRHALVAPGRPPADEYGGVGRHLQQPGVLVAHGGGGDGLRRDRRSTRLNSSHQIISYAVNSFSLPPDPRPIPNTTLFRSSARGRSTTNSVRWPAKTCSLWSTGTPSSLRVVRRQTSTAEPAGTSSSRASSSLTVAAAMVCDAEPSSTSSSS